MKFSFLQKLNFFFTVAFAGVLFICIVSYQSNRAFRHSVATVEQSRQIIHLTEKIVSAIKDMESGVWGYVLTADTTYLSPLRQGQGDIFIRLSQLDSLTENDLSQHNSVDSLRFYVNRRIVLAKQTVSIRRANGLAAGVVVTTDKLRKNITEKIKTIVADIQAIEKMQLNQSQKESDKTLLQLNLRIIFLFLLLNIVLGFTYVGVRHFYKMRQKTLSEVHSLYDSAPCGYHSLDRDGFFIQINSTELEWLGYSRKELIGKVTMRQLLTEPSQLKFDEMYLRLKKDGSLKDEELEIKRKDDSVFPILTNAAAVHDEKGNFIHCRVTIFDITERKKFEEEVKDINSSLEFRIEERTKELKNTDKRFRALIENSSDAISLMNDIGEVIYQSPSAQRMLGYTLEEFKGKTNLDFIHPDDAKNSEDIFLKAKSEAGVPFYLLQRTRHKSGHFLWTEGNITNLLHDESVKAIVSNFRDITERKEAEEKLIRSEKIYRTIASDIPNSAILMIDTQERFILVDGEAITKLGYEKNKLENHFVQDVISIDSYTAIQPMIKKVLSGKKFSEQLTLRNNLDFLFQFAPLFDGSGSIYAAIIIAVEITEIKKAQYEIKKLNEELEERVKQRTEQLEAARKDLESFSYSVSHDLRSPLRVIDGFAEVLNEDYSQLLDDEGRKTIGVIKSNAEHMGRLIDNLLDLSRLGRQSLRFENTDMRTLVNDIITEMNLREDFVGVIKVNELATASCDHELIKQVWINLISNAVKYSRKATKPHIEIGSKEEEGQTIFFIKDNGAGFDMQFAPKLFGVFQRMHRVSEFEGTGVGLAIVHQIVTRHGGKIWAEAKINEGASFYFTLTKQA